MSGKINLGEQFAISFLKNHGLRVERFTEQEMRPGKTPDFRVFKQQDFVFYAESKHVQIDDWLDEQLKTAAPLEIVGGVRHDPTFNRLAGRIHDAAKQFAAVNPNHEVPNVLIFTNSDQQCGMPDLISVLTGNFYAEGGGIEPIYKFISEGRIREEKLTIDLYVWLNEWKGEDQKGASYSMGSKHDTAVCAALGYDPTQRRSVPFG